jgi:hypothetical protein
LPTAVLADAKCSISVSLNAGRSCGLRLVTRTLGPLSQRPAAVEVLEQLRFAGFRADEHGPGALHDHGLPGVQEFGLLRALLSDQKGDGHVVQRGAHGREPTFRARHSLRTRHASGFCLRTALPLDPADIRAGACHAVAALT